jgi:antirestriction protein ArdC
MSEKKSVNQIVTDRLIEVLDKGVVPWRKTWAGNPSINFKSRNAYRGVNNLLLPYGGEYMSFKQAQAAGGHVKKGETGFVVVFYKTYEKINGETGKKETFPVLRYSTVFHLSQIEGVETKIKAVRDKNINPIDEAQKIVDSYVSRSGVDFQSVAGSDKAYYLPSEDVVTIPDMNQFENANEYYSTAFHELVHSSGAKSRLDRIDEKSRFGNEAYSFEELVAEIGAASLMNIAGIEIPATFENSTAYVDNWKKVLKGDNKIVIKAAREAQKAVDLILGQTEDTPAEALSKTDEQAA